MYSGTGVPTPRGTGTSGYVQSNRAKLPQLKKVNYSRVEQQVGKDREKADMEREPNAELLDHEQKRAVEAKCLEFEELMEERGYSEEEVRSKVNEYRQLLSSQLTLGGGTMAAKRSSTLASTATVESKVEFDPRNSHVRAKLAKDARESFRAALGIGGSSKKTPKRRADP